MINYCPFESPKPVESVSRLASEEISPRVVSEDTECNYIVMFFIAGVFVLALSDAIRK